ncbi:TipAS antibiotic-recognition domain-containing protein [Paenibacillus sp. P26]|nr:TipAS antibiotic-recognition domain-containing protein [Paenibacillus sp. P26]
MGAWEYFTPQQQAKMMKKMEQFTTEQLKAFRKESNELINRLSLGLEQGLPPENEEIISLAKRLEELQNLFNDKDPEVEQAIERFHMESPAERDHGIDLKLYRYIQKAKSCT